MDRCIQFDDPLNHQNNAYTIARDGITICSSIDIRLLDSDSQMYEKIWTVHVDDHGKYMHLQMTEHNRAVFWDEFHTFISRRSDFELVGHWRDWDFDKPMAEDADPDRSFALLQRL